MDTEDTYTVKDELEYYANKGLNPWVFSNNFLYNLSRDKQFKELFGEDTQLHKDMATFLNDMIAKTFENQDKIKKPKDYTLGWLKEHFKINQNSFNCEKKKDLINKSNENNKVMWNIYKLDDDDTLKQHKKRWEFVHFFLKSKLVYPALWFLNKTLGKNAEIAVPRTIYNENVLLFDAAFEQTIRDWNLQYLKGLPNPLTAGKDKEWWEAKIQHSTSSKNMRLIKNLFLQVFLTDTAYREWLNLFIHNVGRLGSEHYKRVAEAGNGKIRHLFYFSGFAEDVHYLHLYKMLRDRTKTKMVETGNVTIRDKPSDD